MVGGVGVGLVAVRTADRRAQIVGDEQLRAATHELERAHVRGDPVGQGLRPRRLGVGVVRRPEHRDEDLRLAKLSGVAVDHRDRVPGVVDEHPLAGAVLLAHHHVDLRGPLPVPRTEPAVLHPLGMNRLVLLPQQRQRHPLATQLAVHLAPLRGREPPRVRPRRRIQPLEQRRIVERLRQRPGQPLQLRAHEVLPHRRRRGLQTARYRPDAHPRVVVQTQDLSNLTHRQPPLCHRGPLPKGREDHTHGRLSRVVQLRCSDPSHRSSGQPKSDRHGTGISDRHRLE